MKKYAVLFFLLLFSYSNAQKINSYKYALVPAKYSFLRENDQYQLNSLTKFLMEKQGFITYLDTDELPEDFILSNCNKVYVDVLSTGNFMGTKLKVVLKDCKNNILFTSLEGKSKEKEYKKAYHEALREAFKSFSSLQYVYTPSKVTPSIGTTEKEVAVLGVVETKPDTNLKYDELNLFAQPTANGFQLVDSTPKVVMKIFNTSIKDIYIARVGDMNGVFLSKDNQWYFEYYQNEKLISEKIKVKF